MDKVEGIPVSKYQLINQMLSARRLDNSQAVSYTHLMPGRAIMNKFMTRVMNGEQIPHSPCHGCLVKCSPKEIPYCITDGLINAVKGNVDEGLLFCGAKAWKAEHLQTVQEVINDLF